MLLNFIPFTKAVLCPNMLAIFKVRANNHRENHVLCSVCVEYSVTIYCNIGLMIPRNFQIFLIVFCLDDLSIGERGIVTSPTITILESI